MSAMHESGTSVRQIALWIAALALLAHLGLGAGTVWNFGPINYDDPQLLDILHTKSVGEILTTTTWYAYKPLYLLSLKVDTLAGDATVPFGHGVNWLLHGLATFLLVLLLYDIFRSRFLAVAVGVLFAVHPVHVENVAWFAERKDVLSLVFVLLAHRAYRRARADGRALAFAPAILLLLGGLTKGTVWSYAGILLVDDWLAIRAGRVAGESPATWRRAWGRLAPVLLVAVGGVALDLVVAAQSGASGVEHGVSTLELAAAMASVHMRYVQHVLVPVGLALDYAVDPAGSWTDWRSLLGLLLAAAIVVGLVRGVRRGHAALAFGAAFWVFGLAPVNNIWPRTAALMADRYLYIPAIGAYVLLAFCLQRLRARGVVLGATAVALALVCGARTTLFASSELIWTDTIEKVPHSALAFIQRGTDRSTRGLHRPAGVDADAALALEPRPEFRVRALLLRCQSLAGLATEAAEETERAPFVDRLLDEANEAARVADGLESDKMVRDDPSHVRSMAQNYVGNALEMQGDGPGARDAYGRAVRIDPRNANAWMNYGTMLLKSREPEDHVEAINALRTARDLAPDRLDIVLQLALAHGTRGDAKRALEMLDRAEARHGVDPETLYTRASVLLRVAQDWERARGILRQLREVDAHHPKGSRLEADIEVAIGRSRLQKGRDERDVTLLKQAVDHFDEALRTLPSHWQAHVFAGDAFAEQGRFGEARRRYKDAHRRAPREAWLAGLIARTAMLEAAVVARNLENADDVIASAEIVASALGPDVRRIDLGFAPLHDELVLLNELAPLVLSDREPERTFAAELLVTAALLVTGDELAALDRLRGVFGRLESSVRETALLDAALVLRSLLHERQTEFDLARRDYDLLAIRRPDDVLPRLRQLQIDLRVAEARRTVALGHADDPERLAQAELALADAADRVRVLANEQPGSESAGLLAVQAEINLQQWIEALRRLNALKDRFPHNPSIYRGFNAVYVAWYTQTRDQALIKQADENLREARRLAPRDLRTAMDASQLARIAGDLDSALRNARLARELESHSQGPASRMLADLHVELGKQALEGGQLEEVKKAVQAARRVDPSRAGSWILEGELALKSPGRDRVSRAHAIARQAKALEPYNADVDALLAKCHKSSATSAMFHMGRYAVPGEGSPGRAELDALPEAERSARVAALEKYREQYRQQAIHDLDMALVLDPRAEDVADTRHRRDALAAASPGDQFERNQKAQALVEAGDEHRRDARLVDALYAYWEASRLAPGMSKIHLRVAQTAVQLILGMPVEAPDADADGAAERREAADKYERMAHDALYVTEALDPERAIVQVFFLKGLLHQHRWRVTPAKLADAREVARLAAIDAFDLYALRLRAAGRAAKDDPTLAQALERLDALRKGE
ncbi:MAG: hypothetical protein O2894_11135 [Planctomycetota bacterium]|nr:hypothetical protein [Planctomycetota bacterium]